MAKNITFEQFIKDLDSVNGRLYLETLNNPEYKPKEGEKSEEHHVHPVKLGGENGPKVTLTIFGHCLAHLYLAKAAMEKHTNWIGEAKMMLIRLGAVEFKHLSEAEQFTLEDVHHWSELRAEGHKECGKKNKERYANMTEEERQEHARKSVEKYYSLSEEEKQEWRDNHKKWWASLSEEEKQNQIQINVNTGWYSKTEEEQKEIIEKRKYTHYNKSEEKKEEETANRKKAQNKRWDSKTKEEMDDWSKLMSEAQSKPDVAKRKSDAMQGKNKNKTYVNNGKDWKFVTQEEADYLISIGWVEGTLLSNNMKGYWWMTSVEDEHVYQVIPRKQPDFIARGYYHCISRKNRNPYEEKVA